MKQMKQPGVKVLHGLIWICIWIYLVYGLNFVIMLNPICDDDLYVYIYVHLYTCWVGDGLKAPTRIS